MKRKEEEEKVEKGEVEKVLEGVGPSELEGEEKDLALSR